MYRLAGFRCGPTAELEPRQCFSSSAIALASPTHTIYDSWIDTIYPERTNMETNSQEPIALSGHYQIWTLSEVAEYLKVSEKSVSRLIHRGEIPAIKVGGQWRFLKGAVEDWLSSSMVVQVKSVKGELIEAVESQPEAIPISRFLHPGRILPGLQPMPKEQLLSLLCHVLQKDGAIRSSDVLLGKLLEREKMISTALPGGLALPHPREPDLPCILCPSLALGICPKGMDFGAPDHKPTHLIILICAASVVAHVRILGRLAVLFRGGNLVQEIQRLQDPEAIHAMIIQKDLEKTMGF